MDEELRNEIDNCDACLEIKQQGLLGVCQYHLDKQFESDKK